MIRRTGLLLAAVLIWAVPPSGVSAADIQEVRSPGGITAWLVQEPSIPMLAVEIRFRGGASLDPAGKEGLANLLSGLLDEGAGDLDSQTFQGRLEDLAISLSYTAGRDGFSGSMRTLTEHTDEAFRLLRLSLTEPRFDQEPVERIRSQVITGIRSREQNPDTIVGRTLFEKLYPNHPYGRPSRGTPKSVTTITVDDLRAFVDRRFAKGNLIVGVVGDISAERLSGLLDQAFGDLPEAAENSVLVADVVPVAAGGIEVIRRPIPQSVLMWAMPGIKRNDPDYFAAVLMNCVLGGGSFTSRLYAEVREKRGLAYSVYSAVVPYEHSGIVLGGVGTQNGQLAESLSLIQTEIKKVAREGITAEELEAAKTYTTGAFPLSLTSNARIAGMLVTLQVLDLGIDYLERRAGLINQVTLDDVRVVAGRLLDVDAMSVVVVGDPEGVETTP
ncbi:MAG: pitrilysin family protein [Alphaproteobacteria bacterium]|nr:pitrilysin family protein [Alphaproteobacteria bacterium]